MYVDLKNRGIYDALVLFTLVALAVPPERIEEVAEIINRYSGVTHNYVREDEYNVWFTYIAESKEKLQQVLASIRKKTGLNDMLILPATHTFKVNVNLKLGEVKA
jgi:hypothetical protein